MNLDKEVFELSMDDILPNRFQPREVFDEQALNELALSIREHGVIQPIIVRKIGDKYEIIAGERRFRASQIAGKKTIPALVRNIDDKESAKIALLENLQRKNLTSIEEARTYDTILKLDNMTQEELANNLGKSQSTVANKLRLLNLDESVQDALLKEQISERHARSLLNVPDKAKQKELLNKVIMNRMTVKQLDDEIAFLTGKPSGTTENDTEGGQNVLKDDSIFTLPNLENKPNSTYTPDYSFRNPINNNDIINNEEKLPEFSASDIKNEVVEPVSLEKETPVVKDSFVNNSIFFTNPEPVKKNEDISNLTIEQILANYNLNNKKALEKENAEVVKEEKVNDLNNNTLNDFSGLINPVKPEKLEEIKVEEPKLPEFNIPSNPFNEVPEPPKSDFDSLFNVPYTNETNVIKEETASNKIPQINNNEVYDLRFAINNFRQAVQNTEKFGFKVETEEFDFDNVYQIVIRIDKNK